MTTEHNQPILIKAEPKKPFKESHILLCGAAYGLLMRILFGMPPFGDYLQSDLVANSTGAMMASFAVLVPALIGALVYYYSAQEKQSFWRSVYIGFAPTLLFIGGTAILLIEGSICIAMALPLFLLASAIGGIIMWLLLKYTNIGKSTVNSMLIFPLLLAPLEAQMPLPNQTQISEQSLFINAKPEEIWHLINHANDIKPAEMSQGWVYQMGVPLPLEAVTVDSMEGRVRKVKWSKNIAFDEPILDWKENQYIRWSYAFTPSTFPKDALDEHVEIGGKYFNLVDTSYTLTPQPTGTRLDIKVSYRVSTNFNWYAKPLGGFLVNDTAKQILLFYKNRAENKPV